MLREHPQLVNARDDNGVSALLLTFYHRRPEARAALLAAGAQVGPLEAAALGDLDHLQVNARGGDGFTPLHLAAFFGGVEPVNALLAMGAHPDADNDNTFKVHPLHSATSVGDEASVRALLEAGANPNVQQQGGYTPLHSAAHNGDAVIVRLLLDHGADPTAKTEDGQTPADLAPQGEVCAMLSR